MRDIVDEVRRIGESDEVLEFSPMSKEEEDFHKNIFNDSLHRLYSVGDPKLWYEVFYVIMNKFIDYKPTNKKIFYSDKRKYGEAVC